MSLVDYASSSDEEEDDVQPSEPPPSTVFSGEYGRRKLYSSPSSASQSAASPSNQQFKDVSPLLPVPMQKLPDASMLLSSPMLSQTTATDHSSRVATAMAENASRKREVNGPSLSQIRGKIPRGNVPHSKHIPDTGGSQLVPPQLRGRSNVVTEDISKLFVKKKLSRKVTSPYQIGDFA